VVVQYRGRGFIERCVASCLEAGLAEVIVVDNEGSGSTLGSGIAGPRVRLLAMPRNVGYGRAANAGLEAAGGDAALVLNQDAAVDATAVDALVEAGLEAGAWVAGPALVGPDGREAPPKEHFPPPLSWSPPRENGASSSWRYVPWVPGAAMLLLPGHTDLRFDPRVFMFAEDEELCWRVWQSGGRVVRTPKARVSHEGGTATRGRWSRRGIAARTMGNRARMVVRHAGWRALPAYVAGDVWPRARRRLL